MQNRKGNPVEKNVTQNDVAKMAGVTRSMVSYVINGNSDRSVAPETRQRILDAIETLGYRPNKAAQALQQGDVAFVSHKIGVVLSSAEVFRRPYYTEILEGIHLTAHEHNYHVSFIRFFDELKDPVLFNDLIHEEEIGGLILVASDLCIKTSEDIKIIERIKERLEKVICVDWKCDDLSSVFFDRRNAAYKAGEYLLSRGYSDIAYIGHEDDRIQGVKQFFFDKGLGEPLLLPAMNMETGYYAVRQQAATGALPRAIICGSDEVAIGILRFLNEADIAVPQEVALISIDNIEMAEYTNPPLTTIDVPKRDMGAKAVEMIMQGNLFSGGMTITLPATVIPRKSC